MKWVFAFLLLFLYNTVFSQQLYLELKSNNVTEDSLLNSFQSKKSFKDVMAIEKYSFDLIDKLKNEGFFNIRHQKLQRLNDSVFALNLMLNKKYTHVYIRNLGEFRKKYPLKDSVIKTNNLQKILYNILNSLSAEGKAFSQIQLKEIEISDSDTISANAHLDISKKRIIDDIIIRGYDNMPKGFVKNYAAIRKGDIYNKERLLLDADRLAELNFLEQTKAPQVLFTPDSTKLYMYYKKSNANSFDGFLGFNNSDENDVQLIGNIDLKLVNNFNYGEELNLNYRNDGNEQEKFVLGIRLPYIFNSKFSLEAQLNFFRQDSTFSNSNQNLKFDYQINPNLNAGLVAEFEESSNLLSTEIDREDIADYTKDKYGFSLLFLNPKRLNPLFLPSQYLNFKFGFANRNSSQLTERQEFATLEGRYIIKVAKRQFVYSGIQGGFLSSDEYLTNELYRLGGINSIRGFTENRFFANIYGTIQTEYRYILGSNLFIHSVLDYGFFENAVNSFDENLYSLGIGIGLQTKAGLLRFIAANGGSSSEALGLKNTQIHLKFVTIF